MGVQTSQVLTASTAAANMALAAANRIERHPRNIAGNGSLMRTGPVALAALGDDQALDALAREISALTHPDPQGGSSETRSGWSRHVSTVARLAGYPADDLSLPPSRRVIPGWGETAAKLRDQSPNEYRPARTLSVGDGPRPRRSRTENYSVGSEVDGDVTGGAGTAPGCQVGRQLSRLAADR